MRDNSFNLLDELLKVEESNLVNQFYKENPTPEVLAADYNLVSVFLIEKIGELGPLNIDPNDERTKFAIDKHTKTIVNKDGITFTKINWEEIEPEKVSETIMSPSIKKLMYYKMLEGQMRFVVPLYKEILNNTRHYPFPYQTTKNNVLPSFNNLIKHLIHVLKTNFNYSDYDISNIIISAKPDMNQTKNEVSQAK